MNTNHNIVVSSLVNFEHDSIDIQQTNATTETYLFYRGAVGTNLVATITVVYTDSNKTDLDTVSRVLA